MTTFSVRVWDWPTRLFHLLLIVAVAGALISIQLDSIEAKEWHGRFGHFIIGLLAFRLAWGVLGSTHARFWNFVRGPGAIWAYLRGRWQGLGHNPLGALSVLALLIAVGFQAVTGLFANDDVLFSGPLRSAISTSLSNEISTLHRQMEWVLYGLIGLHIAAILFYAVVLRENLITPMITGRKRVTDPNARSAQGGGWIALIVALAIAVAALWVANGSWIPAPPPPPDLGW